MVATRTCLPCTSARDKMTTLGAGGPLTGPYGRERTTMRLVGHGGIAAWAYPTSPFMPPALRCASSANRYQAVYQVPTCAWSGATTVPGTPPSTPHPVGQHCRYSLRASRSPSPELCGTPRSPGRRSPLQPPLHRAPSTRTVAPTRIAPVSVGGVVTWALRPTASCSNKYVCLCHVAVSLKTVPAGCGPGCGPGVLLAVGHVTAMHLPPPGVHIE